MLDPHPNPRHELSEFETAFRRHIEFARIFHQMAADIGGTDCPIDAPQGDWQSPRRNFFSVLFLVLTARLCRDDRHMPLYAMTNMAMRICVTACDNILDDEDKETLNFRLPQGGPRTKSILAVMVADRVLAEFVGSRFKDTNLCAKTLRASLRALMSSAIQELTEEARPVPVLPSAEITGSIHQRKTADLFAAPLALPAELEHPHPDRLAAARKAAMSFGLACQILDDMKDMSSDARSGRHNLLISLESERRGDIHWLETLRKEDGEWWSWQRFPTAAQSARRLAAEYFEDSFSAMGELGIRVDCDGRNFLLAQLYEILAIPR